MTPVASHVAPCGQALLPAPCPVSCCYEAAVSDNVTLLSLGHHGVVHLHATLISTHAAMPADIVKGKLLRLYPALDMTCYRGVTDTVAGSVCCTRCRSAVCLQSSSIQQKQA